MWNLSLFKNNFPSFRSSASRSGETGYGLLLSFRYHVSSRSRLFDTDIIDTEINDKELKSPKMNHRNEKEMKSWRDGVVSLLCATKRV